MLRGRFDSCIICAKPNDENSNFGNMLLLVLFCKTLMLSQYIQIIHCGGVKITYLLKDWDSPLRVVARESTIDDI